MSSALSSLIYNYVAPGRFSGTPAEYRLVAPICSAIDSQSFKTAIQLCTKELKKAPNHYILLALKVVALSRSSRPLSTAHRTEIMSIVEFVQNDANGVGLGLVDVLRFLIWVLQSIGRGDETLVMLAKATSRHPENEDVCVEAFLHYVRIGHRKLAQQIGMKTHRNFPTHEPYLWWSTMSILLQVREPDNPMNPLLLSLAERQITTYYQGLRTKSGIVDTPETELIPENYVEDNVGSASGSANRTVVSQALRRDKGKGKGKARIEDEETDDDASSIEPSQPPTPAVALAYSTAHVFHLVARYLELRAINAVDPASTPGKAVAQPRLLLPSLSYSASIASPREALLAHFASAEGERWCKTALGLEIQRRELELRYGTIEGGEWMASWERLHRSIQSGDTNWHTMLFLIRVNVAIAAKSSAAYEPDAVVEQSRPTEDGMFLLRRSQTLFRTLADDTEKGRKERGFLLGLLEIARECRRRGWVESTSLAGLCTEYFDRFSTKMCCFDDLRPYLAALTAEECVPLQDKFRIVSEASWVLSPKETQRLINALKVARLITSEPQTASMEEAAAEAHLRRYFEALPIGEGLPATETQPADDFALLAGQAYVSAWRQSSERVYLEKALAILEYAARRSKHKYQIRILLVNLYRLVGASSAALGHYRILGVKQVQFDTLSHLVLERGTTFSIATSIESVQTAGQEAHMWYKSGISEAAQMPGKAYNLDRYNKIEEFVVFHDRLQNSLSSAILRVEWLRMKVLRGSSFTVDEMDKAFGHFTDYVERESHTFVDNRDFQTLPNLQSRLDDDIWTQTQMGPRTGMAWLRAFSIIYLRLLFPSIPVSEDIKFSTAELTSSETGLFALSLSVLRLYAAGLEEGNEEDAVLTFFREQESYLQQAMEDPTKLPWEILHIASAGVEGYCLLDLSLDIRLSQLQSEKAPEQAKHAKRLKNLRMAARDLVRDLGSRVFAYGKQTAKQRTRTTAGLVSLVRFPLLDEAEITAFSTALIESRRTMVEGLASGIIKRCAK